MISLKRHIEAEHTSAVLLRAMKAAYAGTLAAVGSSAVQACPSADAGVERQLSSLGARVAEAAAPGDIEAIAAGVRTHLQHWADSAEDDLRRKTSDVKELLVTLAHTAASVAASDAEHVLRFDALTARLRRIATLDDVRDLRHAVLDSATELCASVEAMSRSTRAVVAAMQTELDTYQERLAAAEKLAEHDPLTGLFNRRKIEGLLDRWVGEGRPFTIGLIDLDEFKTTNDRFGHGAGDDLLRQFSADLKANARPGDAVGRWGGDEFVLLSGSVGAEARAYFDSVRQWVGGRYTLEGSQGAARVHVTLSIGTAEWRPGVTAAALLDEADRAMYSAKRRGSR